MKKVTINSEKDVLNPLTWNRSQWKDAILGVFYTTFIFAYTYFILVIFG